MPDLRPHDANFPPEPIRSGVTLLEALRAETAPTHQELERRMPLDGGWSRERYVAFLRGTLAVVATVEPLISSHLRQPSAAASGADRLRHDLAALEADADVAPAPGLPEIDDAATAFGAAYVLQGSMLGGAVIARTLDLDSRIPRGSLTYLRPPGRAAGSAWREFTARLNVFGASASVPQQQAAVATARQMFASFAAAFAREGVL